MRNRKSISRDETFNTFNDNEAIGDKEKQKYASETVPLYTAILFLLFLLALFGVVVFLDEQLPTPLKQSDEGLYPDRFIAERAQKDLKYLTDLGPRVVGSDENEVLAVEFLKKRITDIIHDAHKNQKIELDVQVVTGSYFLDSRPTGKINIYANVQNVIAKLHGQDSNNSLLLNAHFDSVPTSPGGSDDGINCAAMLEVLRKFSRRETRPLYSVVFLFNGAEESALQASHGFVSKHKWAAECRAVVNLEAAGAGGGITMFQTGPDRPWLNEGYGKVLHPTGQAAKEELFQANVIPSDTDFRIFRDFGNMVGIDMAFVKDGYRYHTKFDGFDNIPLGSYQQVGDNTMSLVESIANNPELVSENPKTGKVVFFVFLGTFISYSSTTALVFNLIVVVITMTTFVITLRRFDLAITEDTISYFLQIVSSTLIGWFSAFVTMIPLAVFLDFSSYRMTWYGNPWLILGIYVVPAILSSTPMFLQIRPTNIPQYANSFIQAQIITLIWGTTLVAVTLSGIRTTYPLLMIVLFNTLSYVVILSLRLERSGCLWKIIYVIISTVPTSFLMGMSLKVFGFFIPLTGRIGSNNMPDLTIGFCAVLFTLLVMTPYYFLITVLRRPANFYKILSVVFVVCFAIVFTPLSFPYSGDPESPRPQRFWILHSQRVFHGEDGGVIEKDSGYFFMNMDRNSPQSIWKLVGEMNEVQNVEEDCKKYLLCGVPLGHPKMIELVKYSTWIPAPVPSIAEPVTINVNSKIWTTRNTIRYNITIFGPDHLIFYVWPKKTLQLKGMNFLDKMIDRDIHWNNRPYYVFVYTCGKEVTPLNAILDFSVPENHAGPVMDITVIGNYVHPKRVRKSPDFEKMLSKFPDWADLTTWVANYQAWVI